MEEQAFSEGKVVLPWNGRDYHGQVMATIVYRGRYSWQWGLDQGGQGLEQ